MNTRFEENTWLDLDAIRKKDPVVLMPIGQIEEHGHHLPVKTDAFIAEQLCARIAAAVADEIPLLVTPTVWSGYSTREVLQWPGCMSIRLETFIALISEMCGSLIRSGFKKIVLVSCHGNHTGALEVVTRKIADDHGVYMALTVPTTIAKEEIGKILEGGWRANCHSCEYETSLMLALEPEAVRMNLVNNADVLTIDSKFYPGKAFISTWGLQKSTTGAYGDPTLARKEKGEKLLAVTVRVYADFLREFHRRFSAGGGK